MKSLTIHGVTVREWDEVRLTGACCSWTGGPRWLSDVKGTVATVSVGADPAIKVWPAGNLDDGKLWFRVEDIDSLVMLRSGAGMRGEPLEIE